MPITKATASSVAPAAKGDLVVGSATNDSGILSVGSANQVLTVDSSTATGLKWAAASSGGMTLLSTTTLSGTATAITGISQDYNELHIWLYGLTNATANGVIFGMPKNSTTYLDTYGIRPEEFGTSAFVANTNGWRKGGSNRWSSDTTGTIKDRTNADNFWHCVIPNYASTTTHKGYEVMGGYYTTDAVYVGWSNFGIVQSNSAVNAFEINNSGGNYTAGTVKIYGVK